MLPAALMVYTAKSVAQLGVALGLKLYLAGLCPAAIPPVAPRETAQSTGERPRLKGGLGRMGSFGNRGGDKGSAMGPGLSSNELLSPKRSWVKLSSVDPPVADCPRSLPPSRG